ncbi:hypothetical protein QUF72_09525 [Desulfobacterales bacterium HSG2]|nr:hypothetical protein [Desulfobacterales bacterium HSG2]
MTNPNPFALSRSVRIDKSEPLAGECLRGIYQSSASVEGMPAHARFGLPNPNPGRQASVCGGFANPPRAWKGMSAHARFGLLNPKHSAGECLRGICQSPTSLEGYARSRSVRIAKSEPLCSLTLGSD